MNIKVIGSGSSGNCYRIDDGKTALLLECGLSLKKIKAGCNYDLSSISGCLVTHEHGDHILAANDLMKSGIDVYMTKGTAVAAKALTYRLNLWKRDGVDGINNPYYHTERIGTFTIKPFMVHHDAAEPVGYLIESKATGEKLLFVTDTYYIDYTFDGLTHVMVEANYSDDALADADNDGRRSRVRHSHMSIDNCVKMLKANDLSQVKEIWLIHLSSSNGDIEGFKRQVQEATGAVVRIA
ncbi:MBL fold metallo-hydrolase [Caproiciproducens sp.]|uniref:MBL fold metallo-hydrolase n=1 Tax=Caproiciproducens sp. TaxID=1954376 RepID=UPI00289F96A4|nr:MBL fold metallo-hydrolase [Caproiciproducens sp.]